MYTSMGVPPCRALRLQAHFRFLDGAHEPPDDLIDPLNRGLCTRAYRELTVHRWSQGYTGAVGDAGGANWWPIIGSRARLFLPINMGITNASENFYGTIGLNYIISCPLMTDGVAVILEYFHALIQI
jgi:hypothetical protein